MLLWMLLLTLAPGRGQTGVPPKAFLLLKPPWTTAFENEKVTIVCNSPLPPVPGDVTWYDDESFMTKGSKEIRVKKSGSYRCRTSGSSLSDPVHVEFSSGQLILRAPHPIFEGDNVTLKCQERSKKVTEKKVFYKDGQKLRREEVSASDSDAITLQSVSSDNGLYHCATPHWWDFLGLPESTSNRLRIQVQELFPLPVLTASPAQPVEGGPVTLTCETQLSPQRPDVRLRFRFFREKQPLGSGWSWSPELRILTVWREDSSYWCQAETETHSVTKRSLRSRIPVQIPVSRPVLTLAAPGTRAMVGDVVELHCEAQRGSPPILYRFYHEDIALGSSVALSGGGASFNLSLTKEYSGNYFCEADNGPGAQHSEAVTFNFTGSSRNRIILVTVGVAGGLLSVVSLAALVRCIGTQRKSGETSCPRTQSRTAPLERKAASPAHKRLRTASNHGSTSTPDALLLTPKRENAAEAVRERPGARLLSLIHIPRSFRTPSFGRLLAEAVATYATASTTAFRVA
ncbi:Fc receptor-like protein 3 [Pteropus vampyrus]|uniref:Fc receptor-like protein 3 n=1 Tax=Pteropus vampyrus TaxID=132908 RepID=A0A6P6CT48_PTEVA|nr:Fc receptor-like protein 3 [Pteropus vampyrus]